MREIKFNYIYEVLETGKINSMVLDINAIETTNYAREINDVLSSSPKYKLIARRQFTNKHDKNGKEIYQGDVVRWTNWTLDYQGEKVYKVSEVIWKDGAWRLKGNDLWIMHIYPDIEVIGNIFENPELKK